MGTSIQELPALDPKSNRLNVVVDTPKGSRNKYKFDETDDLWRLSKILPQGSYFPSDFGFLPSTRGEDGDPVDVLLLTDEPTFPGCVVPARLIGVLEAEQTEAGKTVRNDRLVAVVETSRNPPIYYSLDEVDSQQLTELEHFFVAYNEAEGRQFKPLDRQGVERAQQLLEKAIHKQEVAKSQESQGGKVGQKSLANPIQRPPDPNGRGQFIAKKTKVIAKKTKASARLKKEAKVTKRELTNTDTGNGRVRRSTAQSSESADVGKSLTGDRRKKTKIRVKSGRDNGMQKKNEFEKFQPMRQDSDKSEREHS